MRSSDYDAYICIFSFSCNTTVHNQHVRVSFADLHLKIAFSDSTSFFTHSPFPSLVQTFDCKAAFAAWGYGMRSRVSNCVGGRLSMC